LKQQRYELLFVSKMTDEAAQAYKDLHGKEAPAGMYSLTWHTRGMMLKLYAIMKSHRD
jgi:hypothetical protein